MELASTSLLRFCCVLGLLACERSGYPRRRHGAVRISEAICLGDAKRDCGTTYLYLSHILQLQYFTIAEWEPYGDQEIQGIFIEFFCSSKTRNYYISRDT